MSDRIISPTTQQQVVIDENTDSFLPLIEIESISLQSLLMFGVFAYSF